MTKIRYKLYAKILVIICVAIFINGCNKKENNFEADIVAHIGEHRLTVKEFQINYEFGFAHLKKGKNRKLSYLENMISEKLLALEGYRLNLDETERVQNLEKQLLEELLVEELFLKEVDEKVQIYPQEIKDAISKSNVRFKLRYWIEPSLQRAETVNALMQDKGFINVVPVNLSKNREKKQELKDFETDYLTWLDIPQELFKEIKDLEIGEISKPIEFDQLYITLQVIDIKNGILSDYDYKITYNRFKQILTSSKIQKEATRYVSQFMTPKNIVTKASAFKILVNAFAEWKTDSLSTGNFQNDLDLADDTKPALHKLKNNLKETLINFNNGNWTLEEFIVRFDPASIKSNPSDKRRFKQELNHQIAMKIRNYFLAKEAIAKGLDKSAAVEKELGAWRDKWVYEETRQYLTGKIEINEDDALKYFEDHSFRYKASEGSQPTFKEYEHNARQDAYIEKRQIILAKKVQSLKNKYTVRINKTLLDSISLTDFDKSRWANLLIYKSGSGRQAVPVVDPTWSF